MQHDTSVDVEVHPNCSSMQCGSCSHMFCMDLCLCMFLLTDSPLFPRLIVEVTSTSRGSGSVHKGLLSRRTCSSLMQEHYSHVIFVLSLWRKQPHYVRFGSCVWASGWVCPAKGFNFLSSELQPTDMDSCIATTILLLLLSCSSNIIYRYHLTGKWTGVPSSGMDYGMDNGMYSWHVAPLCFRFFHPQLSDLKE